MGRDAIRIVVVSIALVAMSCLLTAASAHATHPRPKGATPTRMALVPAYAACASPNRTHGPPLAFPACNPPAESSAQATVGTPDAYGGAANAIGSVRLDVLPCDFNCFDGDFVIHADLNDVRCAPTGARCGASNATGRSDYSGEMRFSLPFRLTDHFNATAPGGGTDPATVQDFTIQHSWACVQTGSTSTGSTCNLFTTLHTIIPGAIKDAKRTVLELDVVRVFDGGADGDGDTTADNTVFARPGVFIP